MQRLVPHFEKASDMAARLMIVSSNRGLLENAFNWLADGVALLRADGSILYVNETLCALAQRGDAFRIAGRTFSFGAPVVRRRFEAALGAIGRLGDPSCDVRPTDFPVPRSDGLPAYIVSVRPLVCGEIRAPRDTDAEVILLVRDPLYRNIATSQLLRELFGLTNAEAHLAQALCIGTTTTAYAIERHVSLNTVYSHLKRIREKTGCKSLPELIRKFAELYAPLRPI
jgi:DNA-binding CsgD family transcriptional regulator